jgi:hypothetical protein
METDTKNSLNTFSLLTSNSNNHGHRNSGVRLQQNSDEKLLLKRVSITEENPPDIWFEYIAPNRLIKSLLQKEGNSAGLISGGQFENLFFSG